MAFLKQLVSVLLCSAPLATHHVNAEVLQHHELAQRSVEAKTWALETRDLLGDLSNCNGCQKVLSLLKGVVQDNDDTLLSLGKQLCISGTSYDEEFCKGVVDREGPIIADLVRTVELNSTTSFQFCVTFLGVCQIPDVNKWAVPFPSKKTCGTERPKPSGKKAIQIVQYSDIHVDPLYVAGSSSECGKATCCRPFNKTDESGVAELPCGPNGDHNCDSPISLEESMYKAIQEIVPKQAFTLFTGDIVDHSLFNTSKPYVLSDVNDSYERMNKSFHLVYGTIGNHESHPANIFEPKSLGNESQWIYNAITDDWSQWISGNAASQVRSIGAYSTKYPGGNLRVISLNTNVYYRFNFLLYQEPMERDPNGQIEWLVGELDQAEKAGENVYIIGHMPFGVSDALTDQSNYLDQVVKRYSSTIRAMFFGHTHVDQFEVSYSNYSDRVESNAMAISYICPSLTPTSGMPSFRVYDVDPDTFAVLDATTYAADMNDPAFQTKGPVWKKYYSFKDTYGSQLSPPQTDPETELTPGFWHNVTAAFETSQTLFDGYMGRKSRGWKSNTTCTGACRDHEICGIRAGRSQDNCFSPTAGVHFSKRQMGAKGLDVMRDHHHAGGGGVHDECGVSIAKEIFHAMASRLDLLEMAQDAFLAAGAQMHPYNNKQDESLHENDGRAAAENDADSNDDSDQCAPSMSGGPTTTSTEESSTSTDSSGPTVLLRPFSMLAAIGIALAIVV